MSSLIRALLAGSALLAACGGGDGAPDAGPEANPRLVILDPPGDSIGLAFGGTTTLRVRYETDAGEPIPDAAVDFQLVVRQDADPRGAALSATTAMSDALGIARVDLVAGAEETTFQIEAIAPQAASAFFTVSVSQAGFAHIDLDPFHDGWRDPLGFERIELRLYRAIDATCAAIDADEPPLSLFPPRALSGFDEVGSYQNVIASQPYTLVAWALLPDNTLPLAYGCVELGPHQVPPSRFALAMPVRDRAPRLPGDAELVSTLDLEPLADAAADAGTGAPWTVLSCAHGPGQLLLDCTTDVLGGDGTLDCVVDGANATVTAIQAARGPVDEFLCRPGTVGIEDSLDHQLNDAIDAGGDFPMGGELGELLDARADLLADVQLRSTLQFLPGGLVRHRLVALVADVGGTPYEVDLASTSRPVIAATAPAAIDGERNLVVGEHGFTLRYGSFAGAAWRDVALPAAGVAGRDADLGAALAGSAEDGGSATTGCNAVSAIICAEIGQAASCAYAACQTAAAALDDSFTAWWRGMDGDDLDLRLQGSVPLVDGDDDLAVDGLGTGGAEMGSWQATWDAAFGADIAADGSFAGSAPVEEP
jgi:hypothetical protein